MLHTRHPRTVLIGVLALGAVALSACAGETPGEKAARICAATQRTIASLQVVTPPARDGGWQFRFRRAEKLHEIWCPAAGTP